MNLDPPTITAIFSAGGVGAVGKAAFDWLTARGERRTTDNIFKKLQEQIQEANDRFNDVISKLMRCEHAHAQCEANVTLLTAAINETRAKLAMKPVTTTAIDPASVVATIPVATP